MVKIVTELRFEINLCTAFIVTTYSGIVFVQGKITDSCKCFVVQSVNSFANCVSRTLNHHCTGDKIDSAIVFTYRFLNGPASQTIQDGSDDPKNLYFSEIPETIRNTMQTTVC